MNEPIQKDESQGMMAFCNSPELDEICPVCDSAPGFRCRAIVDHVSGLKKGTPISWFHRGRTAKTFVKAYGR